MLALSGAYTLAGNLDGSQLDVKLDSYSNERPLTAMVRQQKLWVCIDRCYALSLMSLSVTAQGELIAGDNFTLIDEH